MNDTSPTVRLVVLNFNGGDFVHRCLTCLSELDYPDEADDVPFVADIPAAPAAGVFSPTCTASAKRATRGRQPWCAPTTAS